MDVDKFRIKEGSKLDLSDHRTDFTGDYTDKKEAVEDLQENVERLRELQDVLYAQDKQSLLIIFQAMDAAGMAGGDYWTTNYPQPTFLSSSGYACHADVSSYSVLDFTAERGPTIEIWQGDATIEFTAAPTPAVRPQPATAGR